ncbi:MAG: NADH-quinone oxidoreductase subunit F, partial [Acidobacteria bacterium]
RGQPRIKPPFPALVGAFGSPTVINNVETLCNVPHIVARGGEWFSAIGTDERNTGPKLYCISGHVERPGTYEFPIGATLDELIEAAGGMYQSGELKAFQPGGASAPILPADKRQVPMDFDNLATAGSMLGSAAVIVMDETTCLVRATLRLAKFFNHESCGQCTPCREGTNWAEMVLRRIEEGRGGEADPELILRMTTNMTGTTLCPLADAAVGPIRSLVESFGDEVERHVREGACPLPPRTYFQEAGSG